MPNPATTLSQRFARAATLEKLFNQLLTQCSKADYQVNGFTEPTDELPDGEVFPIRSIEVLPPPLRDPEPIA